MQHAAAGARSAGGALPAAGAGQPPFAKGAAASVPLAGAAPPAPGAPLHAGSGPGTSPSAARVASLALALGAGDADALASGRECGDADGEATAEPRAGLAVYSESDPL